MFIMLHSLRTTLLLFFTTCIIFCNPVQSRATDAQRVTDLDALRKSSSAGLIPLDIDQFQHFIESAPRSYALLVMFSAPPDLCQPCAAMTRQFEKVSEDYYKLSASLRAPKPLFFVQVKLSVRDQPFLQRYTIHHVPLLYFFSAGSSKAFPRPLEEGSINNYDIQKLGIDANSIKEFVNARTGSRLKVLRANYQIPFVDTVRAFVPAILMATAFFAAVAVYTGAYNKPMLWFGLVVLVYIFSVGGGHYSWIHNVPFAVVNRQGHMEFIASGSRSQYVAEGFIVSAICVGISALVILIQELPSLMPSKAGQTVTGLALVVATIFGISVLSTMYLIKMPQYLQYSELS